MYRRGKIHTAVVTFNWQECSELSYTEKSFSVHVHDKETKEFIFNCSRVSICLRVLNLCTGLHVLHCLTVKKWENPEPEMAVQRKQAIAAAMIEREALKKDAMDAKGKVLVAKDVQTQAVQERIQKMQQQVIQQAKKGLPPLQLPQPVKVVYLHNVSIALN